jgi:hypothetical protein
MTATKTVEVASFAGVFDAEHQDDISDMYVEDSTVVKGYRVVRQQGRTFGSYFTDEPTEADIRRVKAMWAELIAKNENAGLPVTTVSVVENTPVVSVATNQSSRLGSSNRSYAACQEYWAREHYLTYCDR